MKIINVIVPLNIILLLIGFVMTMESYNKVISINYFYIGLCIILLSIIIGIITIFYYKKYKYTTDIETSVLVNSDLSKDIQDYPEIISDNLIDNESMETINIDTDDEIEDYKKEKIISKI